mmetsp:Transcript_291/g.609  ORF Transcript_291/g.609 Transcript_291/m.609 type:complete len:105 (-) Transcript_291:497-811(-)
MAKQWMVEGTAICRRTMQLHRRSSLHYSGNCDLKGTEEYSHHPMTRELLETVMALQPSRARGDRSRDKTFMRLHDFRQTRCSLSLDEIMYITHFKPPNKDGSRP